MDGISSFGIDGTSFIDGITDDVHNPAKGFWAHWDFNGCACVIDILPSDEAFSGVHGDGAYSGIAEMLGDFEDQSVIDAFHFKCVEDGWDLAFELYIDDGTDDL